MKVLLLAFAAAIPATSLAFQCASTGYNITDSWVCDGARDCADNSDESVCVTSNCRDGFFTCRREGTRTVPCVLQSWVCDGDDDCGNNTDEENCHGEGEATSQRQTFTEPR